MRLAIGKDNEPSPMLLDFHSPTSALAVEPVAGLARPVTWTVATLAAACFIAAEVIPIDKVVTAHGRTIALDATSVVQPLETAIIRSIDVHEGDRVSKGQILARLDPTFAAADRGALQAQVTSLQAEVDRLSAEAGRTDFHPADGSPVTALQRALFLQHAAERSFKNESYNQKIESLQTQLQRAMSDVTGYTERLKVADEVEQKRIELERLKVGSQLNRLAATDSRLEVKRGLDSALAQVVQAQREVQALQAERDAYNENWRGQAGQELTEQSRKLSDANENLAKADLRRRLVELRADQDGTVLTVAKASPGSVMQSGEQLITLVATNAPLEAEINVAGSEAGYIHSGNRVTIKFDTLPYTNHGTVDGVVRVVSPDSFSAPSDDQQSKGGSPSTQAGPLGSSYYRVRVTLDAWHLRDTPRWFEVTPGMPLTADVKVGQHTLVRYLLSRVLPTLTDGMREP